MKRQMISTRLYPGSVVVVADDAVVTPRTSGRGAGAAQRGGGRRRVDRHGHPCLRRRVAAAALQAVPGDLPRYGRVLGNQPDAGGFRGPAGGHWRTLRPRHLAGTGGGKTDGRGDVPRVLAEVAAAEPVLEQVHGLAHVTLIHDLSMDGHAGFPTWEKWLEKAEVRGIATSRSMKINNSAAVLQAAIEGRGVALARSVMAHDNLAAGRLSLLYTDSDFSGYYVVYRP